MALSDQEIAQLLDQLNDWVAEELESETLEFKSWKKYSSQPKSRINTIVESVICFANQKGGTLILGVENNKLRRRNAITGCKQYNIDELKKSIYDSTDPKLIVNIREIDLPEGTILAIDIPKGIPPHTTTKGIGKIRIGKYCKPLTGSLLAQISRQDTSFDWSALFNEEATSDDIDILQIERLRKLIRVHRSGSKLAESKPMDLPYELGLLSKRGRKALITNAALLFIGKKEAICRLVPQHEIFFRKAHSDTSGELLFSGHIAIPEVIELCEQALTANNRTVTIKYGLFHDEIPIYSWEVLREALANALAHRDYILPGSVNMRLFKEKIEISNPGNLPGGITPDNILYHDPIPRNRLIAEVFQKIGLVERAGYGVNRMYQVQLRMGQEPPQYQCYADETKLIIPAGPTDTQFLLLVHEMQRKGEIGLDELIILYYLKRNRDISRQTAAKITQRLKEEAISETLVSMQEKRWLEHRGKGVGAIYSLSKKFYRLFGKEAAYYRDKGLEYEQMKAMVLATLEDKKFITNDDCQIICSVNRNQAYNLLKNMRKEGLIKPKVRKGRNASWERVNTKEMQKNAPTH